MRIGTVVRASRRQKFFDVVWDAADAAATLNVVDHLIPNEHSAGKSDLLDGRGLAHGDRVVEVETPDGWKVKATGENWPCEPEPERAAPTSDKSAAQLHAEAMRGTNQQRVDEFLRIQGPPRDPDKDDELLYGR
jgi:hypothetical protein